MEVEKINICQNCISAVTDTFCSFCGQKKYKRIDRKYIWDEVQYTVFHANKGLLYSIKSIIKNPGKTAREFIDGNRVNHYKPILLVFVLSGISTFMSFKVIGFDKIMKTYYSNQNGDTDFISNYMSFVSSYNSIIMLFFIPFFAIFTKLAFRKWGHNYYEHIVMNAFGLSCYIIISNLVIYPILYFVKNNTNLFMLITNLSILPVPFIMTWFYKDFYKDKKIRSIIWRVLLILFGVFICMMILTIAAIIIYVNINGPEILKSIQPK
jgi:hypothetical protein